MLGPGVPRSARRRCVGRPPWPVSRAWPGPDRGRMAGLHPPRWTIRNRQRWPPRGPARRDGRQWAQRASRGGRGVRGGAGRVLTVSLLMAPAGGSGRRHACLARTPPPWATRCGGEARRTARPTRWAGAVGRAGEKASPPRRGMRGGEAQAGTLRLRAAALDRDTPLRPHRLGTAAQGEAVSLRGLKPSTAGAATAARLGRSPGHGDEPANCRRGPTTFTNPNSRAHNLAERTPFPSPSIPAFRQQEP